MLDNSNGRPSVRKCLLGANVRNTERELEKRYVSVKILDRAGSKNNLTLTDT